MMPIQNEYVTLRNRFMPTKISLIFVLESPPAGHGYFYNPDGRVSEVLFRSYMKVLGIVPKTKSEGLKEFQKRGWLLVNPIYEPVNKLPDKEADKLILKNYQNFTADLKKLLKNNKNIPIVLVKSNIIRLLEEPLLKDGFNVINHSVSIPFPLHYHLKTFEKRLKEVFSSAGI